MPESKKRLKILKKTSYEEQISQTNKNSIILSLCIGMAALTAIYVFSKAAGMEADKELFEKTVLELSGVLPVSAGIFSLTQLIKMICKKTILESKVEEINDELEELANAEKAGKKK